MTEHVKACPFCGRRAMGPHRNLDDPESLWWISCTGCQAEMSAGRRSPDVVTTMWNTRPEPSLNGDVELLLKRVFLAGHSEGWTGNQQRRDVQHMDAEKGWSLYVSNGALDAAIAALSTPHGDALREALERIAGMTDIEADFDGFEARAIAEAALAGQQAHE